MKPLLHVVASVSTVFVKVGPRILQTLGDETKAKVNKCPTLRSALFPGRALLTVFTYSLNDAARNVRRMLGDLYLR